MTASKIPIKKLCEYCKRDFLASKVTTQYCSHQCNSRAYKAQRREQRVRNAEYSEEKKKLGDIVDNPYLSISEATRLLGLKLAKEQSLGSGHQQKRVLAKAHLGQRGAGSYHGGANAKDTTARGYG